MEEIKEREIIKFPIEELLKKYNERAKEKLSEKEISLIISDLNNIENKKLYSFDEVETFVLRNCFGVKSELPENIIKMKVDYPKKKSRKPGTITVYVDEVNRKFYIPSRVDETKYNTIALCGIVNDTYKNLKKNNSVIIDKDNTRIYRLIGKINNRHVRIGVGGYAAPNDTFVLNKPDIIVDASRKYYKEKQEEENRRKAEEIKSSIDITSLNMEELSKLYSHDVAVIIQRNSHKEGILLKDEPSDIIEREVRTEDIKEFDSRTRNLLIKNDFNTVDDIVNRITSVEDLEKMKETIYGIGEKAVNSIYTYLKERNLGFTNSQNPVKIKK